MQNRIKVDVVVTRHDALVDLLRDPIWGLDLSEARVIPHAREDDVRGKVVAGVLPHRLSSLCKLYIEISLDVPPALRGRELTKEEMLLLNPVLTFYVVYALRSQSLWQCAEKKGKVWYHSSSANGEEGEA